MTKNYKKTELNERRRKRQKEMGVLFGDVGIGQNKHKKCGFGEGGTPKSTREIEMERDRES